VSVKWIRDWAAGALKNSSRELELNDTQSVLRNDGQFDTVVAVQPIRF
jgi:hypothetical protein